MRDPTRIKKVLKEIEEVWTKYPDLRLFQLLINCGNDSWTNYYIEDENLVERLKKIYGGKN